MAIKTIEGIELNACDVGLFRHKAFQAVVVSGSTINICGHTLLNIGGELGYYIHVAGVYKYPHYMTHSDYKTYLTVFEKKELRRTPITVPFPDRALLYLEKVTAAKWGWGGVVHNCATMVEDILRAGGAHINYEFNCPILLEN